ncbi:MAG TPA: hypothetical protein VJ521_10630, partial [Acidobacteriota bacterium]|nr:hypothetical protein [Acidobacteriota bacterium]
KGVEPLLKDVISKLKLAAETPKSGTQFGMRVEYDLKKAVYGLVRNDDPAVPYAAKVIVRYEKFLESETLSRSYGSGTVQFLFAYTHNRWVLLNYQQ